VRWSLPNLDLPWGIFRSRRITRMATATATLDRFVNKAGQLYSLPAVALQVLELTEQPRIDARELKQCIERDPALTSKLLRVVNSSLFGLSRQVSDLNQAIALLGIRPLKLLVLGFCLPDNLTANLTSSVLNRYWYQTLIRAVASRELAHNYWKLPADEAFLAGLLQDIGTLVLIQALDQPYLEFLDEAFRTGHNRREQESRSLGFNHCELSARLLDRWGLPNSLVRTIEASGRSANAPLNWAAPMADVLRIADLLATSLTQTETPEFGQLLSQVAATGLMDRQELAELIGNLEPQVVQLAEAMSLQIPKGADHHQLVVRAQKQLAAIANDAALALLSRPTLDDEDTAALWEQTVSLTAAAASFGRPSEAPRAATATANTGTANTGTATMHRPHTPHWPSVSDTGLDACSPEELLARIDIRAASCRAARQPLSLMVVQIDRYDDCQLVRGQEEADRLARTLFSLCRRLDTPLLECHATGECTLAILLPDCDRAQAVTLGNQLLRAARALDGGTPHRTTSFSISLGIATNDLPARNFRGADLLAAADRCLHGAQHAGDSLKSIGVY